MAGDTLMFFKKIHVVLIASYLLHRLCSSCLRLFLPTIEHRIHTLFCNEKNIVKRYIEMISL